MKAYELMAKAVAEPEKYEGKKYGVTRGAVIDMDGNEHKKVEIIKEFGTLSCEGLRLYVSDSAEVMEIQQEVPFFQAAKAHSDGKKVMVRFPFFNNKDRTGELTFNKFTDGSDGASDGANLSFYLIREGKWFILDD